MAAAYKGKTLAQMNQAERSKRIAHLVATGNTAAIKDPKYLTTKQAKQRVLNARLNAPVVPGSTMTGRDLAREANAATQIQYRPQKRALEQAQQQNVLQRQNTSDYYDQFLQQVRNNNTSLANQATQTAATLQRIGEAGQRAATQEDTSVLQQMQADAAQRGATVDPRLALQATQTGQVGRTLSDAQAGTAALLGQAGQNYGAGVLASGGASKLQALAKNALAGSQLAQQRKDLAADEGQQNLVYRQKRRGEELTNVSTAALANVNAAAKESAAQTARINARSQRISADASRTRAQRAGQPSTVARPPSNYTGSPADWNNLSRAQRDAYVKAHPTSKGRPGSNTKDAYGNTRDQRIGRSSDFRKAKTDAATIVDALKRSGKPVSFDTVYAAISPEHQSVNVDIIKGAVQQALGGVDTGTGRRLQRLGVNGGYVVKKRVVKRKGPIVAPGPAGTIGQRPT